MREAGADRLSEYRVFPARTGEPSAIHVPKGILVHSAVDPMAEAAEFAQACRDSLHNEVVLVGGGLGYLPEAMAEEGGRSVIVQVVEPDRALFDLARVVRPAADYFTLPQVTVTFGSTLHDLLRRIVRAQDDAAVIVSPYLERILSGGDHFLSGLLALLRSERVSRSVYRPLLDAAADTASRLAALPSALSVRLQAGKMVVVAGAGPSLDQCVDLMRAARSHFVIVAASGAVPPLHAAGIDPDWIIALEARDTILRDLRIVHAPSKIIVFPSTHPGVLQMYEDALFSGLGADEEKLATRGGTSVVPALDFALRASTERVALVGVDLGYAQGHYARNADRARAVIEEHALHPPKFEAMRAGLEMVLNGKGHDRCVFHVTESTQPLRGTTRVPPGEFARVCERSVTNEVIYVG